MDARSIFASVMEEAGRLGLAWWERIALILAAALLIVMGREARRVIQSVKIESPEEPFEGNVGPNGEAPGLDAPGPTADDGTGAGGG